MEMSDQNSSSNPSTSGITSESNKKRNNGSQGIGMWTTTFFLFAQVSGSGFLALPAAIMNTGWTGVPFLMILGGCMGYAGTCLGHCWVMLEERWPEYGEGERQPYMEIAYRSFGLVGRRIMQTAVLSSSLGVTIVFIILIPQFFMMMIPDVSMCILIVGVTIVLVPFSWLGTPKDFWQGSILASIATVVACVSIVIQLVLDIGTQYIPRSPSYGETSILSVGLGLCTILFGFGGAAQFPTLQNDMQDRRKFWLCIIISFTALVACYLPVAITGYALFGQETPSNIFLYRDGDQTALMKISISLLILNLLVSFLVLFNTVTQSLEKTLHIPLEFGPKRIALRSSLVVFNMVIALAIPDFSYILDLIGGSTIVLCSLIAPAAMYLKLVADKSNPEWPQRYVPLWKKVFFYQIIIVGALAGIMGTGSAIMALTNADFTQSCFSNFN